MHQLSILLYNPVSFINGMTPFDSAFIIFCAQLLPWITIVWVLVYLFFRPIPSKGIFAPLENIGTRMQQIFILSASAVVADVLSLVFKNYFKIVRPVGLNFNLHPLLTLPIADYGFPSSHASVFAAIAAALFLIHRRAGIFAALLALIIGAARIFAGVHTPLDILGGYLLGIGCAVVIDFLVTSKSLQKPLISVE